MTATPPSPIIARMSSFATLLCERAPRWARDVDDDAPDPLARVSDADLADLREHVARGGSLPRVEA